MVTAEDKQRFLELIREGNDRATAAYLTNPDYTGSMFKRLCNPKSSKYYDAAFAEQYAKALEVRGPLGKERAERVRSEARGSSPLRLNGFTKANHLTDEQLTEFFDLVSSGVQAAEAARRLTPPTSITQIHRRAERDAEFAEAFRQAKDEGYPAYKEELRAEATRQAFAGDYRALRDQMLMHLDEARVLSTQRHEVGAIDIRLLVERHLPYLSAEMLDRVIAEVEAHEQHELPAAS